MFMNNPTNVMGVFEKLFSYYGPQGWWPGDSQLEICLGAILTQNTSWNNVEKALQNLKSYGICSIEDLSTIPDSTLAKLIYSSGYFNSKTKTIKAFVSVICSQYGGGLAKFLNLPGQQLRAQLLDIKGIGEETADDIILYAAQKPTFVIDSYTRRIGARLKLPTAYKSYSTYRHYFLENLPNNIKIFNEFHALFVRLAKDYCFKQNPNCNFCPLLSICETGNIGGLKKLKGTKLRIS